MLKLKGFTLIEILVSVAIFAIVMVISLGALLSMSESDRKAQTLKAVINNLNFSLDSMSRSIRTGQNYHCDASIVSPALTSPNDCASATSFAYRSASGGTVIYKLISAPASTPAGDSTRTLCTQPTGVVGCVTRSTDSGVSYAPITAPEVVITNLQFIVKGSLPANTDVCNVSNPCSIQPKVSILLSGSVSTSGSTANCTSSVGQSSGATCFNLQTSVTQRLYDQ